MNVNTANASATVPAVVGDLADPANRIKLARRIHGDIDAWCAQFYNDGHRTHLGASLIGRECSRYLWYVFRWVKQPQFDGRMQRLFQRGHREEAQFIEMLEGIGARVEFEDTSVPLRLYYRTVGGTRYRYVQQGTAFEPNEIDVTDDAESEAHAADAGVFPEYPQFRISGCEGHFGGSLDGKLWLPEIYGIPLMFINEFKTQGTGKFSKMKMNGVRIEKPEHYTQMSIYGNKMKAKYGCYMAVNKNDDDLHIEIVELDWGLAERMEVKAHNIIFTRTPPQKLSQSIAHSTCQYCDMKDVCHQNVPYERNCRSCANVEAVANKEWGCHVYGQIIPKDAIKVGCDRWTPAV